MLTQVTVRPQVSGADSVNLEMRQMDVIGQGCERTTNSNYITNHSKYVQY